MTILEVENERIHIANDADAWERGGRIKRVYYEPGVNPGLALIGASGSGKTYLALLILARIGLSVRYDPKTGLREGARVVISDYKRDSSFRFLLDPAFKKPQGMTTHYYGFKESVKAIHVYDNEFRTRLGESDDDSLFCLYIDELSSLLSGLPKAERSEIDALIYQHLAMQRSLGMTQVHAAQRFDSIWYSQGARENIQSRVGMGALSKDSAKMLFPDTSDIQPQGIGRGYYQTGETLSRIIVPQVTDTDKLHRCIFRAVTW
jgi:DNA replication protein DnaC